MPADAKQQHPQAAKTGMMHAMRIRQAMQSGYDAALNNPAIVQRPSPFDPLCRTPFEPH